MIAAWWVGLLVTQVSTATLADSPGSARLTLEVRGGTPFTGVGVRWRPAEWVELAARGDLVSGDAALRGVVSGAWLPLRGEDWAVGLELGVGGGFGLRARSTADAEVGLRARVRWVPALETEVRLTLLGLLGPVATHTSLVGQVQGRVSYRLLSPVWVGVEGGALLGFASQLPVLGVVCGLSLPAAD